MPSPSQPTGLPSPSGDPVGPAIELSDQRTAYSRTFAQPDGKWQIEEFADPVNYQPDGSAEWQPIDLTFGPPIVDGATTSISAAPSRLSLFSADNARGFLRLDGHDGQWISFGLPEGTPLGSQRATASIFAEGAYAEYSDFLAGGIGLRVFPHADGFTSFLLIPSRPASNVFTFTVTSDLRLEANEDGSYSFHDAEGNEAGRLPRPYLVDSSDMEGRGGGLYSEAVTMTVTPDGTQHTMTLTVDPAFLDQAVYPIYLDPSTTTFPSGCSCTSNDTFASSKYPGSNFNMYQRPDSPFYNEMWHGNEPGTSYYNEVYIRFNDLEATLGSTHIDSAYLKLYPYHQYTSPKLSWVDRMADGASGDWGAGTLKWNNRPALDPGWEISANTSQGTYSSFDVTSQVQDVVNGVYDNNGFMIHANSLGQGGWKRFISGNDSSSNKPKLVVTVTPFGVPSAVYPTGSGETATRTMNWSLPSGAAQGAYDLQVDRDQATPYDYDSGTVTSSVTAGMVPTSTTLIDGQTYSWRVKVKYGNNSTFSSFSNWATFVYHQGATLGLPGFDSFEWFDLGTADSASVNVTTGNLVVSHPIVSLPIQGSSLSFGLTYNSEATATAGMGQGWRLNATRRLAELGSGDVVVTAGDGSIHTFTKISTVGTVTTYARPSTVYATLRKDTSQTLEWTLTYRDLSVDSFDVFGSEGLLAKQADRFGNAVTFTYTASTDRLYQATDPNGRVIDFGWNTSASPAQLTSITDWAYVSSGVVQSTNTGSRRQYRFFYDGSGRLIGWSNAINTSGSCPTGGTNLTCLTYGANGLVATVAKSQTYTTLSGGSLGTSTRTVTTTFTYRGGEVSQVQDAQQTSSSAAGTTFNRAATDKMQVLRQGSPASTTTYQFVASTDNLGRVQSVFRRLSVTDIEQRTAWDSTYPTEPASVTDNYGALLSTPARTISYTYVASSMGLVSVMTEPLTGSTSRTTTYTYNTNNDVTQSVVASSSSSTTTRYCYTTSGCSTSGTELTMNSKIDNYVDGSKGGATGGSEDVTTAFTYDGHGQRTLETRYNYDASGTLLDSRSTGYAYDANGNMTSVIDNYADGTVAGSGDDVTPNSTTGARTDLTTVLTYDTAGNQVSSADPRRAIALAQSISLNADDYVTRTEFDALSHATKNSAPRDPSDASAPKYSSSAYDELGALRQSVDFGGVVSASEYDRAGRATRTFEDTDGAGGAAATVTSQTTFDAAGRVLSSADQNQVADPTLGTTNTAYDDLGRTTSMTEASGTADASTTTSAYDALDRLTSLTVGGVQTTTTAYDLGGRATSIDDQFTCTTTTYDYRDLALTETDGLATGCASGADQRTVTNTYDGLGQLTRTEITAGTGTGDRTFDVTLDSAGRQLTSAVKTGGVTSTTTYTLNPLDQVTAQAPSDGSTSKSNYDAAGNATDQCYWKPTITVGSCYEVGHSSWTNPPTQVTTATYDARNNKTSFTDSVTGSTTTYDPDHNYQIKAFYLPTGTGREHQTLYSYDSRHRLSGITLQLCTIGSGHSCSSTTATGSDSYSYDDNDNRTKVAEDNTASSSTNYYCYDALNRLTHRKTGLNCTGTTNESYTYDAAGNRTQAVVSGTTTNFAYNSSGQLCKTGATSCSSPNVTYDTAGRTASYNGWVYAYDAEGRMTSACKSTSCSGSVDKVEFAYDGESHRIQIKEYTAGTLATTRDFIYQGDAIVQEKTNGTVSREYIHDDSGSIIKFCDPNCTSTGNSTYLITWNGHGDALGAWLIDPSTGGLTLANSFTYSSWGGPTTTPAPGFGDLGLRFLYIGAEDVQWDNFSGLALYYMHARHYAPALGRFLQPDPIHLESNTYAYASNNSISLSDSCGTMHSLLSADRYSRGGSPCGHLLSELLHIMIVIVKKQIGLMLDKLVLPWTVRVNWLPGTIVGHQKYVRQEEAHLRRKLSDFDDNKCFGGPGRALSRILYAFSKIPAAHPVFRPQPKEGKNWSSPQMDSLSGVVHDVGHALGPIDGMLPSGSWNGIPWGSFQELFGPGLKIEWGLP
jgi:RHS repeat-associated protein